MKKYLILVIISLVIIKTHGDINLPPCNIDTAKQAIEPRIFAEQTVDGIDQPIVFTRFIHNKLGIFASEFTRCYFLALDPNFIYHTLSIGIFPWLYFSYWILTGKLKIALPIFFIIPALPFFHLPIFIVTYAYKIFAIIGLTFFLNKKK